MLVIAFIATTIFLYTNSHKTFQATFKNIDGLPIGAQVTALGVKVGEVVRTKTVNDGVIVTVKITNRKFGSPEPGSQLTITSFKPNQGRVLEIMPPVGNLAETEAWILQEPITTESWLHASLELLDNLKNFSNAIIEHVTPENFERVRNSFSEASSTLNQIANKLSEHEKNLFEIKETFLNKANEATALLIKLKKPIESLNKVINDENFPASVRNINSFSKNISSISTNIGDENFASNVLASKDAILLQLNQINTALMNIDQSLTDPELVQNIKDYNEHLINLNSFYEMINPESVKNLKKTASETRDAVTKASEATSMI